MKEGEDEAQEKERHGSHDLPLTGEHWSLWLSVYWSHHPSTVVLLTEKDRSLLHFIK